METGREVIDWRIREGSKGVFVVNRRTCELKHMIEAERSRRNILGITKKNDPGRDQ